MRELVFGKANTLSVGQHAVRLHMFARIEKWSLPERYQARLLTACPYKRHKSTVWERGRRQGHESHFFFFPSPLVYMSWQHVAMCMGDLMSRKGLSDQTPGVCHLQPHAFFFYFWPVRLCSVVWLFSLPCNTWESCRGGKKKKTQLLPASQHIPAPNAWAQPHIVGILSFKGAAVLCLPTPHHSFICRHGWKYLGIMFSHTVGELYGWNITWKWGYRAQKYFLLQICFKIKKKRQSAW